MNAEEFHQTNDAYEKTGFPGLCEKRDDRCGPQFLATKFVYVNEKEIHLCCDAHAPKGAVPLHIPEIKMSVLLGDKGTSEAVSAADTTDAVIAAASRGVAAKLRSKFSGQRGIRLESTGARASGPVTLIVTQTLDASPTNPYLVTFDQIILDPFTGDGQFDLVERDSIRQVFDGVSAGGTAVLTSATMSFQSGDVDKVIQVGRHPGRSYRILSRQSATRVTLSGNITLPSTGLTLTMDGENGATIATKSGFTSVDAVSGWSQFVKVITSDKVLSVVFVPGDTGDGIYSIKCESLIPLDPDRTPLPS